MADTFLAAVERSAASTKWHVDDAWPAVMAAVRKAPALPIGDPEDGELEDEAAKVLRIIKALCGVSYLRVEVCKELDARAHPDGRSCALRAPAGLAGPAHERRLVADPPGRRPDQLPRQPDEGPPRLAQHRGPPAPDGRPMNARQLFALKHPLNEANVGRPEVLLEYRHVRQRGDGVYVVVILAVDR